jgi:hypothetical protein
MIILLKNILNEIKGEEYKKEHYTLYHATDSDYFEAPDVTKAKKGSRYFNPLGLGLYCSTNKEFVRKFGKNIFIYLLPKNSKIKFVTRSNWLREYGGILTKIFRKLHMSYWNDTTIEQKVELNKLGNNAPITSLNELADYLDVILPLDTAGVNIYEIIEEINTQRNSNYDAVWYRTTDYYQKADEVIVPFNRFKSENFIREI